MTVLERRRDNFYKTLLIAMCGLSGTAGGWSGSKISQAELLRNMESQARAIAEVKAEVADMRKTDLVDLRKSKMDREESQAADDALDKRIDDIKLELEGIHADTRMLIQMQSGRR